MNIRAMRLRYLPILLFLMMLLGLGSSAFAQIQIGDDLSEIDYAHPQKYEIGGIVVDGDKGDKLVRYRAGTTGAYGVLNVN